MRLTARISEQEPQIGGTRAVVSLTLACSIRQAQGKLRGALPYWHFPSSSIKPKELFRGFGRGFRQFLQRNLSCTRDRFGHEAGISRLASFTPKWHRREIWTIGFHHEFPERNLCRNRADRSAIFESHDPGKGNEMIEIRSEERRGGKVGRVQWSKR